MLLEETILSHLIHNESYCRRVYPYIKDEYFEDANAKKTFDSFREYVEKYKEPPTKEALLILLENRSDLNEASFKETTELVKKLNVDKKTNEEWLVSETEKFCQNRDIFNAVRRAILILDGKEKDVDKGAIPKILSESLSISFDTNIGHNFTEDYEERYDFYHMTETRIPFDLDIFNKITKGGLPKKSLTMLLATTGGGKTLAKCHIAASAFMSGKNVLYITAEMAEERIAERIDANLLDLAIDDVKKMDKYVYTRKLEKIKSRTTGQLIIKGYPPGAAHAGHFRHLINDLRLKKNFLPDIIIVDYLNICASSRIKNTGSNSYNLIKSVAEEIRGLAIEFDCAIVSSSQYNRGAYGSSDVDLTSTSECIYVKEKVEKIGTGEVEISTLRPGDVISTNDESKIVTMVHHPKMKNCVRIKTKSGKSIIVSKDHVFPSKDDEGNVSRKSISSGLKVGDRLNTK